MPVQPSVNLPDGRTSTPVPPNLYGPILTPEKESPTRLMLTGRKHQKLLWIFAGLLASLCLYLFLAALGYTFIGRSPTNVNHHLGKDLQWGSSPYLPKKDLK